MKLFIFGAALLLSLIPAKADTDPWAKLQFLVGTWQGEGKAEEALGKGVTTFDWEVGHQVLVRHDHTEYATTAGRPASTYEALMVIYKNPAKNRIEANYFDSGNHIIHYQMAATVQENLVEFLSDAGGGPTFKLTYSLQAASDLSVKFEMKPPGDATAFRTVAAGVVHKK